MIFANPWLLLLIAPAIAALFAARRAQDEGGAALSMPLEKSFAPAGTLTGALSGFLPLALRGAALILLALALARPQYINRTELPPEAGVDIMLCLDTSNSMLAQDLTPTRIAAARDSARAFIEKRPSDRIGITAFAENAILQCPLTLDHDSLLEYLEGVDVGITHTYRTAIGDAIATAANHLKNSAAKSRIIILLTDGRSNSGIITDPVLAAKAADSYGIKIYAIGTGAKGPSRALMQNDFGQYQYVTIEDDLDDDSLSAIARAAGGEYFRATNSGELRDIYSQIDKLEKTDYKSSISISYQERFYIFLVPAVLLLLAEFLLARLVFVRIP